MAQNKTMTMSSMAGPRQQDVFDAAELTKADNAIKFNENLIRQIEAGKFDDALPQGNLFEERAREVEKAMEQLEGWRDWRETYLNSKTERLQQAKAKAAEFSDIELKTPKIGGTPASESKDPLVKLLSSLSSQNRVTQSTQGQVPGMTAGEAKTSTISRSTPISNVSEVVNPENVIDLSKDPDFQKLREILTSSGSEAPEKAVKTPPPVPTARKTAKELGLPEIPKSLIQKGSKSAAEILKSLGGGIIRGLAQAPAFEFMAPPSLGPAEGTPEYDLEMGRMTLEDYRKLAEEAQRSRQASSQTSKPTAQPVRGRQ
jgi:hypothetical protein